MFANEVKVVDVTLDSGDVVSMALVRESETGLFIGVESSYLEQDVDVIRSPYGNGNLLMVDNIDALEAMKESIVDPEQMIYMTSGCCEAIDECKSTMDMRETSLRV